MQFLRQYGTTIALIALAGFLVFQVFGGGSHPLDGQPAPEFTLPTLEGEQVSLADHSGKDVIVLDFWASWCPPCRKGLPILDEVARDFQDRPVAVYAVNIREGKALIRDFVGKNKLSLPVLLDDTGIVADDFQVSGIPQTVIIDRNGTIHSVHVGVPPFGFKSSLVGDIESALAAGDGNGAAH